METGKINKSVAERNGKKTNKYELVGALKVVETEVQVERPNFHDVKVERAIFVDKPVERPFGIERLVEKLSEEIANKAVMKCLEKLDSSLAAAIDKRLKEITAPKIIFKEELKIVEKPYEVMQPVFKTKEIAVAKFRDIEIDRAIIKNVPVTNAIIRDVPIKNAVIEDVAVKNAIIQDVPVINAKIKNQTVEAIRPRWLKPDGKPDDE